MLTELIYFLDTLLDQEGKERHQAERVQNSGGVVRLVLDRSELEEVRLHHPRCQTLPLSVYEGTWTHSPLSLLCISLIDLACA